MEFINKFVQGWKEQRSRDQAAQKRQDEAVQALLSGGVTPQAKERITRQLSEGQSTFSSDLSVREYLLCREAGFETIGQVMGSSFYNISLFGITGATFGTLTRSEYNPDKYISSSGAGLRQASGELDEITHAQLKARTLAVERMLVEARLMGAHGVIGLRFKASHFDFSSRMTEFTAIGTAIRLPGVREAKTVFTSDLVGQEFWQLYNAGYVPRELAFGVCSYYVKCDEATRQIIDPTLWNLVSGTSMANQEVLIFTQGFYDARNRAMSRLTSSAINAGADGLVSMDADYTVQTIQYQAWNKTFHDLVIHFVATGTSIAREQRADTAKPAGKPLVCVNLKRGSSRAFELQSDYGFEPADLDDEELLETDLGE